MIDDPELPKAGVFAAGPGRLLWRVWAPLASRVDLLLRERGEDRAVAMERGVRGFFAAEAEADPRSVRYAYVLDGRPPVADPWSRHQPEGVARFSAVELPSTWSRGNSAWSGIERSSLVVYELHVGTFTEEGTFEAIIPRLESLRDLGINCLELMPVGAFPGRWSWGYDGVFPFAPHAGYGGPEGLRRLIDACHARGLAVFLDVIYNHFGPEGNVFPLFGPYLSERTHSDWGPAVNYDGPGSDVVRAMVVENARMWLRDYGVDGLRIDAADQIYDRSPRHILADMAEVARVEGLRRGYPAHVFAENDMNDAARFLGPPEAQGFGLDGCWNDDFHHAAHVVLTGETGGYYADFADGPRALAKAFSSVYVNNGNYSRFRDRRHGAPAAGFDLDRFLAFTQNHDQVGNRAKSDRLGGGPVGRLAAGLLLLAPRIPLLFMGQEYGETNPFPFFCDYDSPELVEAVREGRKREFRHFSWSEEPPDPLAESTRDTAVLSWDWRDDSARLGTRRLYEDLLRLRRDDQALRDFSPPEVWLSDDHAVLIVTRGRDLKARKHAVFNLGNEEVKLPSALAGSVPHFRSEIAIYGSEATPRDGFLSPREFQIHDAVA